MQFPNLGGPIKIWEIRWYFQIVSNCFQIVSNCFKLFSNCFQIVLSPQPLNLGGPTKIRGLSRRILPNASTCRPGMKLRKIPWAWPLRALVAVRSFIWAAAVATPKPQFCVYQFTSRLIHPVVRRHFFSPLSLSLCPLSSCFLVFFSRPPLPHTSAFAYSP